MNMAKLRQILELRRSTKVPPLLPPKKSKRGTEELTSKRSGQKEILDIHLQLKDFSVSAQDSAAGSIACAFSESEETQRGPWRVTTASELLSRDCIVELPHVLSVEFQLERVCFFRLDICDLFAKKEASSIGYCVFSISELVCARGCRIRRKVINDESGAEIAEAYISCTLRPKPHAVLLQFVASSLSRKSGNSAMAYIFFEIHRIAAEEATEQQQLMGEDYNNCNGTAAAATDLSSSSEDGPSNKGSLLYRSESIKWNSTRLLWRAFTLQSTDICGRELRFLCYQRDNQSKPALPLGEFPMHFSILRQGPGPENVYFLLYEDNRQRKKTNGTFELCRLHEVCTPSFLEYVAAGSALNLAFAVDFSRSDLAVDVNAVLHYVDDVELVIGAFGEPLRDFNRIPPQFRESQEFCLNMDTDPFCRGISGVHAAFKHSFAVVQPLNMAHLSHVIYYVAKLAQNSLSRTSLAMGGGIETDYNPPAYFVLVLITRGVFDDLKETVQAIIFASRAPLSIIFVGIGDDEQELAELERLGTAGTRLNFHGRKPERDCTQYVCVPACRAEEGKLSELRTLIAERGLATLGQQMCSWMMRNGYQKAPADFLEPMAAIQPPLMSPSHVARSSTGSLGASALQKANKTAPRLLEARGASVQSLQMTPTSSSSSAAVSLLSGVLSSPSMLSSTSKSNRKSPAAADKQRRFRNLELNELALSLPGSPRRRLPSTSSLEQSNNGQPQQQKAAAADSSQRQQIFSESRSFSTQNQQQQPQQIQHSRRSGNGKGKTAVAAVNKL